MTLLGSCPFLSCCKYGCRLYDNGSQPETTSHCIYQVAVEVEPLKNIIPYPTKTPSISARLFSHTARGNVPPFSCRTFFRNKVRYNGLEHRPRRRRAKPAGSLTHQHHLGGRACRKLGGAGSSPKNTSIVETLRGFSIAYRHHPVKQQRARMPCRS